MDWTTGMVDWVIFVLAFIIYHTISTSYIFVTPFVHVAGFPDLRIVDTYVAKYK